MPLKPGTQWAYEGTFVDEDGDSIARRLEFTITDLTKEIEGVRTVVAWIVDYNDGEVVEKEIAFYAQDDDGNVWYLGEYPEEYEGGEFVKAFPDSRPARGEGGVKMWAEPSRNRPVTIKGGARR
jgi:uncharacterized protein YbaA (DUF1428 family)